MIHAKAMRAGLTMALFLYILFTIGQFAVTIALSLLRGVGEGGGIIGASVDIPSPLPVVAAVVGFAIGYKRSFRSTTLPEER